MNIKKILGKGAIVAGILGASYFSALGINHYKNDIQGIRSTEDNGTLQYITRAEGVTGYKGIVRKRYHFEILPGSPIALGGSDVVIDHHFFGNTTNYGDVALETIVPDGIVDYIEIMDRREVVEMLIRPRDYKEHKASFDLADKVLAETKERFKDFLK